MIESEPDRRQILGIDLLRFLAAMLVAVYHLAFASWASPVSSTDRFGMNFDLFRPAARFFDFGWIGVEIFFVISGFVIAYSAERASAAGFFQSRVLRLGPGAWICSTFTLVAVLPILPDTHELLRGYLHSMIFWPLDPWIDGVFWTLPIEIAFYAVILAALALDRFRSVGVIAAVIGLGSALFWAAYLVRADLPPPLGGIVDALGRKRIGEVFFFQYGCFFALGTLLWLVLATRATLARLLLMAPILAGCLACVVVKTVEGSAYMGVAISPAAPLAAFLLSVGAIVASVRWNRHLHRGTRWPAVARRLGLMTYPLYLLHNLIGALVMSSLARVIHPVAALLAALAVILALAWVAERMEGAFRRRLRPLLAGWVDRLRGPLPALFRPTTPVERLYIS